MSSICQLTLNRDSVKFLAKQEGSVRERVHKALSGLAIRPPIGKKLLLYAYRYLCIVVIISRYQNAERGEVLCRVFSQVPTCTTNTMKSHALYVREAAVANVKVELDLPRCVV